MQVSNAMDPSEWMKQKQQRPVRRTLYEALRKEPNAKCLILTALISGCIVAIVWCRVTRVTKVDIDFTAFPITSTREISPCDDGTIYIPTAFVVMLYLLYLVECWYCKSWHMLKFEKTDVNSAYQKIQEVRQAQPVVWWKAVCYHYVRRTREITRCRNGNAYTCSQVYYDRVNSHVAAGCFFFAICGMKDVSREICDLEKHAATKIQLSKGFLFANLATAREFQEQRAAFFQEQERHDDYMEMREGMDLSNVHFKESLISWASPDNPPWFAKIPVFWLCNFLLLSWPLRLILELNTAHVHYQVNKLFGVNYMSPSGSELLLSSPRSHGLPINNQQYRLHSRAISSHHSRLNPYNRASHRRRSTVLPLPNERLDQEETAPLLLNFSSQNSNSPQNQNQNHFEKDELSPESLKNPRKDQQTTNSNIDNTNEINNTSTNNNNDNTFSTSDRVFFPQWRSSFFSRNFPFSRQTGYKLTKSVTMLMTKPEKMEFLHNAQPQFPEEWDGSDEGFRLLNDESCYYPSISFPPPPPFVTPTPEEGEEVLYLQRSREEQVRSHLPTSISATNNFLLGESPDSANCLAPSYSQALLLMEPNERRDVIASFRNPCDPSTQPNSNTLVSPSPSLTNEHSERPSSGITNVRNGAEQHFQANPSVGDALSGQRSSRYQPRCVASSGEDNCRTGTASNHFPCYAPGVGEEMEDCISSQPSLGNQHAHPQPLSSCQEQQRPFSTSPSISSVSGQTQRASNIRLVNSGSSLMLNTLAPREVTGVQIDLTQPIVMTVPRDPFRESAADGTTSSRVSSSQRHTGHGDDEPPTYVEALRTSRPVFLPTLARIRRCFTERDIASRFSSRRSHCLDGITNIEEGDAGNSNRGSRNGNSDKANEPTSASQV